MRFRCVPRYYISNVNFSIIKFYCTYVSCKNALTLIYLITMETVLNKTNCTKLQNGFTGSGRVDSDRRFRIATRFHSSIRQALLQLMQVLRGNSTLGSSLLLLFLSYSHPQHKRKQERKGKTKSILSGTRPPVQLGDCASSVEIR